MLKTRVTEMLGIEHPILMGGLQWLARAELVAAACNAGAIGFITAGTFPSPEDFRAEIRKTRQLTDRPFGVNISMLPSLVPEEQTQRFFTVAVEEGVPVVETSGRNPEPYVAPLKDAGVKLIHKVPAVRFAKKAESVGADAVTIVGFECAGHPGMDDVTSMVLIPRAVESVQIPVIAGGGIADARGFVAALALGAEAVVMGTRFVATQECVVQPALKEWMVSAQETDTLVIERSIRNPARVARNTAAARVLTMEERGASLQELMPFSKGEVGRDAMLNGSLESGTIHCGQAVGLIHEILSVHDVIQRMVTEAREICRRLNDTLAV